jgi:hypothetical protein
MSLPAVWVVILTLGTSLPAFSICRFPGRIKGLQRGSPMSRFNTSCQQTLTHTRATSLVTYVDVETLSGSLWKIDGEQDTYSTAIPSTNGPGDTRRLNISMEVVKIIIAEACDINAKLSPRFAIPSSSNICLYHCLTGLEFQRLPLYRSSLPCRPVV